MYTGLHLNSFKQLCKDGAISSMPAPDEVTLSLNQHKDALLRPCANVGEHVSAGQVIAKPDVAYSAWLHAPISGIVETISDDQIVIMNDHQHRVDASNTPMPNWQSTTSTALISHLARGGIAGLGGAGYSTAAKLAAHVVDEITTLIINGMECEPYITCDDRMMREQASIIIQGVQILLMACGARQVIIAIENDKTEAIESIRVAISSANDDRIEVRIVPARYPNGDEGRLIKLLLNREVPGNCLPSKIGVITHNVATARACAQWIYEGRPLISRVITVTGHGLRKPQNVEACIGTSCHDLIGFCGGYTDGIATLILGGAMMGKSLRSDTVAITKTSNCLIAATARDIAPEYDEQPCIRCGECALACPANLLPQQLLMYLRNQNAVAALELGLRDCIECGCCDAVCPSHIILATRFHTGKQQIIT